MTSLLIDIKTRIGYNFLKYSEFYTIFNDNYETEIVDVSCYFDNTMYGNFHYIKYPILKIPKIGEYTYSTSIENIDCVLNISVTKNTENGFINKIQISSEQISLLMKHFEEEIKTFKHKTTFNNKFIFEENEWKVYSKNNKTFKTIFLKENQNSQILETIDKFLNNKSEYDLFEQFYKLNFLFYGTSGSGKTSTTNAIANHYNKPIYFINLYNFHSEFDFLRAFKAIQNNSVIVFEDIDMCFAETRLNVHCNISLTCLLNVLDGFHTKKGCITILTANDISLIQEKLLRSLRIDCKVEYTSIDKFQIENLLKHYMNNLTVSDNTIDLIFAKKLTSADFIQYLFDKRSSIDENILITDFS